MTTEMKTMKDLLVHEIRDLYDAEQRLAKVIPRMAESASTDELKGIFEGHLVETKKGIDRLRKSLEMLDCEVKAETCHAMKGLIEEGEEALAMNATDAVRDAALIAAAQRIEHYEMAGFGTAHGFATQAGHHDVAGLLKTSLDETKTADRELTAIASRIVNAKVEQ